MLYRNLYSIRITNGLILQWGKVEGENKTSTISGKVIFPISYENFASTILATAIGSEDFVDISEIKKGEFSYMILDRDYRSGVVVSKNFYWFSIGY